MNGLDYTKYITLWKAGHVDGSRGKVGVSKHVRRYLFEKYDNKCAVCGWCETHPITGEVPLEVHHISGHANTESNLILLCPNCHSLTGTYRGRNKGHGRTTRK
jgi:5-methylcytosine-specific restriction endonuclease McrA